MPVEKKLLVSTDSLGIFGSPRNLEIVWGFLKGTPSFDGVELLGFSSPFHNPLAETIYQVQETGFRVSGIHGRIGDYLETPLRIFKEKSLDPIKAAFLNRMMVDTGRLTRQYGKDVDYVLFHESEVSFGNNLRVITDCGKNTTTIFIENDYTTDPQGLNRAVDRVKQLEDLGVNVKLMLDLSHAAMSAYYQSPLTIWKRAIDSLANIRGTTDYLVGGIHIPLGLRPDDSLPFEAIKDADEIWRDFSGVVNSDGGVLRRVLENQQSGLKDQTKPSLRSLSVQRERNQAIYDYFERFEIA